MVNVAKNVTVAVFAAAKRLISMLRGTRGYEAIVPLCEYDVHVIILGLPTYIAMGDSTTNGILK